MSSTWRLAFVKAISFIILIGFDVVHGHADDAPEASGSVRDAAEGPVPWTSREIYDDPDNFQFVIVTDRTGSHRDGVFPMAMDKTNLLMPEFVVSVGDLIEGIIPDLGEVRAQWDEFEGFVDRLKVPFFYLPGNHDIWSSDSKQEWNRRFGRTYYHRIYRNVLFLHLNTEEEGRPKVGQAQVAYFREVLARHKKVRWTLVFMHRPLWDFEENNPPYSSDWFDLEEALQGRPYTVFAGHYHHYMKYKRRDQRYILLATTGGGSGLRGPIYGEFDHVVWVTMTNDGPLLANLQLDGILSEDVLTEESDAIIAPFRDHDPVGILPIILEREDFQGGTTELVVTNRSDAPMTFAGQFEIGPFLPDPAQISITVPAGEERRFPLVLDRIGDYSAVPTAQFFRYKANFHPTKYKPFAKEGSVQAAVLRKYPIPESMLPPEVDGLLNDWAQLPIEVREPAMVTVTPETWTGPDDAHFSFGVQSDSSGNLYLAFEVKDDVVVVTPGKSPFSQEGIEIRLDARRDPDRSLNRGHRDRDYEDYLVIAFSPKVDETGTTVADKGKLPPGILIETQITANGYAAEIMIPHSILETYNGGDWRAVRLNVALNDEDIPPHGGPRAQLWWRPRWRSKENYPGSGTFMRH